MAGSPAFNGNPERNLLTEPFKAAGFALVCWDDPRLQKAL